MINIRYHIVSITAVFLALAVGMLVGAAFVGDETIKALEARLDKQEANLDITKEESDALIARVAELEEFENRLEEAGPAHFFDRRLPDHSVLLVTVSGTSPKTIEAAVRSLDESDATLAGVLTITEGLAEPASAAELAESVVDESTVGAPASSTTLPAPPTTATASTSTTTTLDPATGSTDAPRLPTLEEFEELQRRQSTTTVTTTTVVAPTTTLAPGMAVVLQGLVDSGVATYDAAAIDTGRANDVLFVIDDLSDPAVTMSLLPFLEALSPAGDARVVVAATTPDIELIRSIRGDQRLALLISTVSHYDSVIGQLAAIIALEDLEVQFVDHYGRETELQLLPPGEL